MGALRAKEEEMRSANLELLQKRDEEYQAKVAHERQREKERSISALRRKEQELQIKDQQLKAAQQRLQELDGGGSGAAIAVLRPVKSRSALDGSEVCLPRLPLS